MNKGAPTVDAARLGLVADAFAKGLSQTDAAKISDVHRNTVIRYYQLLHLTGGSLIEAGDVQKIEVHVSASTIESLKYRAKLLGRTPENLAALILHASMKHEKEESE